MIAELAILVLLTVVSSADSLQARIDAAQPGDRIEVGPGTYRGHLRIDKPLRLIGRGGPVLDGEGNGDILEIIASDVTVSGFILQDTGIDLDKENCAIRVSAPRTTIENNIIDNVLFGIDLKDAADSVVRGNRIGGKSLDIARRGDGLRLWRSNGVLIENNEVHDGRDVILWYSSGVIVRSNRSFRCRYGLHLMYSDDVTMEDNELRENSVGVYFMYSHSLTLRGNRFLRNRGPSGYGLGLKEADRYVIEDNLFAGNRVGVYLDGSPFTKLKPGVFRRNTFAFNDVGITFLPAVHGNHFTENIFVDNFEQVSIAGRGELTGNDFSVDGRGNFWTDYVGYDADGDGIGDWEHAPETLFESLLDKEPKLRLFTFSPAQQAIEFVSHAIPAVRPEPKFFDPSPLMEPPRSSRPPVATSSGRAQLTLAAALGGVACLLIVAARSGFGLARSGGTRS